MPTVSQGIIDSLALHGISRVHFDHGETCFAMRNALCAGDLGLAKPERPLDLLRESDSQALPGANCAMSRRRVMPSAGASAARCDW